MKSYHLNHTYRILHLEDEATDAALVRRELQVNNLVCDLRLIISEKEYVEALNDFHPDVILCDHTLPSFNSFEALKILKERNLLIPFIVITATMSEDVAMTVVRDGADDYILKDRLIRLPHAILNAIEKFRFEKERKQFIVDGYEKEASSRQLLTDLSNKLLLATKTAGVGIWEYIIKSGKFIGDDVLFSLYGINPASFDGSFVTWKSLLLSEDTLIIDEKFDHGLKNEVEFDFEFRIVHADKFIRYIAASALVERDNKGNPWRIVGTNRDVTDYKNAEKVIQKNIEERELLIRELTRSIKDLKQFSYITSHNFRAPLSNLLGLLSFIDYSTLTLANNDLLEMFKTSTLQLNKTINDLVKILIIKNNVNVDLANNNINELLDEVCSSLSYDINDTGCKIKRDLQVENISFNKSYLESILINLLSNAIKYRSPDRILEIEISTQKIPSGEILMIIKDNGIGIDLLRHSEKIFGLYQRFHTNTDSVGLGLFIAKSQITALGGIIEVESSLDIGTSFIITFKKADADKESTNLKSVTHEAIGTKV